MACLFLFSVFFLVSFFFVKKTNHTQPNVRFFYNRYLSFGGDVVFVGLYSPPLAVETFLPPTPLKKKLINEPNAPKVKLTVSVSLDLFSARRSLANRW